MTAAAKPYLMVKLTDVLAEVSSTDDLLPLKLDEHFAKDRILQLISAFANSPSSIFERVAGIRVDLDPLVVNTEFMAALATDLEHVMTPMPQFLAAGHELPATASAHLWQYTWESPTVLILIPMFHATRRNVLHMSTRAATRKTRGFNQSILAHLDSIKCRDLFSSVGRVCIAVEQLDYEQSVSQQWSYQTEGHEYQDSIVVLDEDGLTDLLEETLPMIRTTTKLRFVIGVDSESRRSVGVNLSSSLLNRDKSIEKVTGRLLEACFPSFGKNVIIIVKLMKCKDPSGSLSVSSPMSREHWKTMALRFAEENVLIGMITTENSKEVRATLSMSDMKKIKIGNAEITFGEHPVDSASISHYPRHILDFSMDFTLTEWRHLVALHPSFNLCSYVDSNLQLQKHSILFPWLVMQTSIDVALISRQEHPIFLLQRPGSTYLESFVRQVTDGVIEQKANNISDFLLLCKKNYTCVPPVLLLWDVTDCDVESDNPSMGELLSLFQQCHQSFQQTWIYLFVSDSQTADRILKPDLRVNLNVDFYDVQFFYAEQTASPRPLTSIAPVRVQSEQNCREIARSWLQNKSPINAEVLSWLDGLYCPGIVEVKSDILNAMRLKDAIIYRQYTAAFAGCGATTLLFAVAFEMSKTNTSVLAYAWEKNSADALEETALQIMNAAKSAKISSPFVIFVVDHDLGFDPKCLPDLQKILHSHSLNSRLCVLGVSFVREIDPRKMIGSYCAPIVPASEARGLGDRLAKICPESKDELFKLVESSMKSGRGLHVLLFSLTALRNEVTTNFLRWYASEWDVVTSSKTITAQRELNIAFLGLFAKTAAYVRKGEVEAFKPLLQAGSFFELINGAKRIKLWNPLMGRLILKQNNSPSCSLLSYLQNSVMDEQPAVRTTILNMLFRPQNESDHLPPFAFEYLRLPENQINDAKFVETVEHIFNTCAERTRAQFAPFLYVFLSKFYRVGALKTSVGASGPLNMTRANENALKYSETSLHWIPTAMQDDLEYHLVHRNHAQALSMNGRYQDANAIYERLYSITATAATVLQGFENSRSCQDLVYRLWESRLGQLRAQPLQQIKSSQTPMPISAESAAAFSLLTDPFQY